MAYDRIFSHSRSRSQTVRRDNDKRRRLKTAMKDLRRLTKIYVRENVDLTGNASDFVRGKICVACPTDNPWRCESVRDPQNRYYCHFLSRQNDAYVRLYLPKRTSKKSAHIRANTARKIEDLIRAEPGIRRTRIRAVITGKWETILSILEDDLVFQGRVKRTEKKEKGKTVYLYHIKGDHE